MFFRTLLRTLPRHSAPAAMSISIGAFVSTILDFGYIECVATVSMMMFSSAIEQAILLMAMWCHGVD